MGYKQSPTLIVAALLLLTPLAYGLLPGLLPGLPGLLPGLPGLGTGTGTFTGKLCCTPTGNCPPGSIGIPDVTVNLNCTNILTGVQTIFQGVTNTVGVFNITLPNLPVLPPLGSLLSCAVVINLPLDTTVCPILNNVTGILTGLPTLVNTILNGLLGPVLVFVFQVLQIVTITP
ncbi:hypothetical protein AAHA92_30624 [Salvia divinorum]|uniref:Uncharacterized protein n=1 Tax=Salvia divinorum TaxID=28513 RepID=A0ABD1FRG7_SALDI